jgi:hypothetical protein
MDAVPPTIALIAEGPSDHAVMRSFLAAYFEAPELVVNALQPPPNVPGGWTEVLRYCASPEFAAAFAFNDLVLVQIDTDVCEEACFGVSRRGPDGAPLAPDALVERVVERLVERIGVGVFAAYRERILFAVCVDAIECWLLPLYFDDARREKTASCLRTLNEQLTAREGFSIDVAHKQTAYYEKLLRRHKCHRRRTLAGIAPRNPSLARFVRDLDARFPARALLPPS